mmetsp:Transcript_16617/g.35910  ORF Transcript_16617/g.35910 Transcript_16617/m.35910 type:complete len:106 (+) Transcript_16617:2344-2661(+)
MVTPVSTLNADIQTLIPTEEKKPQSTGYGRKPAKFASLTFPAKTQRSPENSVPKAFNATNVAKNAPESSPESWSSCNCTSTSSISTAIWAKKGAMNISRQGYNAG